MEENPWRQRFSEIFASPASPARVRVMVEVYGEDYPVEVDPYSYPTRGELARMAREVGLGPGEVLVDVGCGAGGPGLWVAARTGARLVGVDIAASAVEVAARRAAELGMPADFRVGTFADTGLEAGSARAVMSVDALIFAPDKPAAYAEFARVLEPGGRLVLTTWDYHRQPVGRPPQLPDQRPALAAAGFDVAVYAETEDWRERQVRVADLLLDAADELAAESGGDPGEVRAAVREMRATIDCMSRRVLVVAVTRPG